MTGAFRSRRWLAAAALVWSCAAAPAAPPAEPATPASSDVHAAPRWIPTWISTQQPQVPDNLPPPPGLAGAVLRQIAQPSLSGEGVRVSFSNRFGVEPLSIDAVHVAPASGGSAIDAARGVWLTFDGKRSVVVPPGASMASDPVALSVTAFANLAVTTAFAAPLP